LIDPDTEASREIPTLAQGRHHLDFWRNRLHKFLNAMAGIGLAMWDKKSQLFRRPISLVIDDRLRCRRCVSSLIVFG